MSTSPSSRPWSEQPEKLAPKRRLARVSKGRPMSLFCAGRQQTFTILPLSTASVNIPIRGRHIRIPFVFCFRFCSLFLQFVNFPAPSSSYHRYASASSDRTDTPSILSNRETKTKKGISVHPQSVFSAHNLCNWDQHVLPFLHLQPFFFWPKKTTKDINHAPLLTRKAWLEWEGNPGGGSPPLKLFSSPRPFCVHFFDAAQRPLQ